MFRTNYLAIIASYFICTIVSCAYDYDQGEVAQSLDKTAPDIVMEDVLLRFVRGSTVTIYADMMELYSSRKIQNMTNVRFKETDKQNNLRTSGTAEYVVVDTDTNNLTVVGKCEARSEKDEVSMRTNYLKWVDDDKRIEGSATEKTVIVRDDDSKISGYGFVVDAKKRTLSMTREVQGQLATTE